MIKVLLVLFVILPLSCHVFLRQMERNNIYFPAKELNYTPLDIGLVFEDIILELQHNIKINGWFIPNEKAKFTVLLLHGNAGNIGDRLDKIQVLHSLGLNVFLIDYRGYGKSSGRPSEKGLYKDAIAAYDFLVKDKGIAAKNIILYGVSLGGAVAVECAKQVEVAAVVTENTFNSLRDMARSIFPFLPKHLIVNRFDSETKVKSLNIPKLFFVSPNDDIVPYKLEKKLYDNSANPKMIVKLDGGHNDSWIISIDIYKRAWIEFLAGL